MVIDYNKWQMAPLEVLEKQALRHAYHAWRDSRRTTHDHLVFALKTNGVPIREASEAVSNILAQQHGGATLLRSLDRGLVPAIPAAIALASDPEAREDLVALERLVAMLHARYVPEASPIPIEEAADDLEMRPARVRQLLDLWRSTPNVEEVPIDARALYWETFEDFLRAELRPGPAPLPATSEQLPVIAAFRQVAWCGLGSYSRPTTLDLEPVTFLVGANASGKTTALAGLRALATMARTGLAEFARLMPHVPATAEEVLLGVTADLRRAAATQPEPARVQWRVEVGCRGRIHARAEQMHHGRDELARFDQGSGRWRQADGALVSHMMRPDQLALTSAVEPSHQWQLMGLRQELARWHVELAEAAPRGASPDPRWAPFREAPAAFATLVRHVREVTGVRDLILTPGSLRIDDGGVLLDVSVAPRGLVRAIELLALVLQPSPPSLLAIDEIENHLHADLAERLIDVMRSVSHRTQLVVTTHSSRILRLARPEEVRVCVRGTRGSSIAPMSAYPHLARLAADGQLDDVIANGFFAEPR